MRWRQSRPKVYRTRNHAGRRRCGRLRCRLLRLRSHAALPTQKVAVAYVRWTAEFVGSGTLSLQPTGK